MIVSCSYVLFFIQSVCSRSSGKQPIHTITYLLHTVNHLDGLHVLHYMWAEKSQVFVDIVCTTKSTKIIMPQNFLPYGIWFDTTVRLVSPSDHKTNNVWNIVYNCGMTVICYSYCKKGVPFNEVCSPPRLVLLILLAYLLD